MRPLPHQGARRYLVWTGMETDLIFGQGIDLPGFASFPLLERADTRALIADYMGQTIDIANRHGFGSVLESVTWMANRDAIEFLSEIRDAHSGSDILISANIGPRDDAYAPQDTMSPQEAEEYHDPQIRALSGTPLDLVSAYTLSNSGEAIGIVRAATRHGLPCVVAFTVELDGRLPSGQPLAEAIRETDAATNDASAYFMINCAHPDHFAQTLGAMPRLGGIVVNASRCSHAELDEATQLDAGDPEELGIQVAQLVADHPSIQVFGGCCGTDMRHLEAMAQNVKDLS